MLAELRAELELLVPFLLLALVAGFLVTMAWRSARAGGRR